MPLLQIEFSLKVVTTAPYKQYLRSQALKRKIKIYSVLQIIPATKGLIKLEVLVHTASAGHINK